MCTISICFMHGLMNLFQYKCLRCQLVIIVVEEVTNRAEASFFSLLFQLDSKYISRLKLTFIHVWAYSAHSMKSTMSIQKNMLNLRIKNFVFHSFQFTKYNTPITFLDLFLRRWKTASMIPFMACTKFYLSHEKKY